MSTTKVEVNAKPVIGFAGLLTLLFIGLKLAEVGAVAHWSWLWVLSPLWISTALCVGFFVLFLLFALVAAIFTR